jgi:hypothetical protein
MTCYFESSVIRYRGVGWIYTPESRNAHIPIIKPDNQLTQLELLAGYVLNVEVVKENFVKKYKDHHRVKIYEIELIDLSKSVTRIAHMMNYFKLVYNRNDLIKVMKKGKTNERNEEKKKARIRDKRTITLDDCRLALNNYRKRVAIESRKMDIT